ncbi:hypothetical protein Bbelb_144090 [Branchiostoma belcheri]|nr:hypothetical protein Bbelb_144090 [Branchiostoma belcheri]
MKVSGMGVHDQMVYGMGILTPLWRGSGMGTDGIWMEYGQATELAISLLKIELITVGSCGAVGSAFGSHPRGQLIGLSKQAGSSRRLRDKSDHVCTSVVPYGGLWGGVCVHVCGGGRQAGQDLIDGGTDRGCWRRSEVGGLEDTRVVLDYVRGERWKFQNKALGDPNSCHFFPTQRAIYQPKFVTLACPEHEISKPEVQLQYLGKPPGGPKSNHF